MKIVIEKMKYILYEDILRATLPNKMKVCLYSRSE